LPSFSHAYSIINKNDAFDGKSDGNDERIDAFDQRNDGAITIFYIKVFDHNVLYMISDNSRSFHQSTSDTGIPQWRNKGFNF
jgi:hypothetical protein